LKGAKRLSPAVIDLIMTAESEADPTQRQFETDFSPPPSISLRQRLSERILREGPMSFCDWMRTALYDPVDGYYCRPDQKRQGRAGDYRTAPETSPLFAATVAHYFAKLFRELSSPPSWTILEPGAATGDFARGVLGNLRAQYPDIFAITKYVIDEIGSGSRIRAAEALSEFGDRVVFQPLTNTPEPAEAGIVFSNELIDAFPVHRVTMINGKLRELCVDWRDERFVWVDCGLDDRVAEYCARIGLSLSENQIAEINLEAEGFVARAASSIKSGFVITVDYGRERAELLSTPHLYQGSLRAFSRHRLVSDCLERPGEQDLTTTIDWTQIRDAGERFGLKSVRHERLDSFLLQEGLLDELGRATRELSDSEALRLRTSARELILPQGLAASFQVLIQEKVARASRP
jgi:SAM-dependent MidA family methyltransferase